MFQVRCIQKEMFDTPKNHGIMNYSKFVIPGKGKSSMRDYSILTDEEVRKTAFKRYTKDELTDKFDRAKQQVEEGKCRALDKHVLDEIFREHVI